jgi:transposase-like protein
MVSIHPNARTTPAVRAEIARSSERPGILARRLGVGAETIRRWRKRGPSNCLDRSDRLHKLPWKASDEERAIVCELRRGPRTASAASATYSWRSTGARTPRIWRSRTTRPRPVPGPTCHQLVGRL